MPSVFNASFIEETFMVGLSISEVFSPCFFKSYFNNTLCIDASPGVATVLPFKSVMDLTDEL